MQDATTTQARAAGYAVNPQRVRQAATLRALADLIAGHPELGAPWMSIHPDGGPGTIQTTVEHIQGWAAITGAAISVYGSVREDHTCSMQAAASGRPAAGPLAGEFLSVIAPAECGELGNAHDHDACIAALRERLAPAGDKATVGATA